MDALLRYLNGLVPAEQRTFAERSGTTVGYLRKVGSTKQRIGAELCINLERESGGAVSCEAIRPDVDWAYIRASVAANAKFNTGVAGETYGKPAINNVVEAGHVA